MLCMFVPMQLDEEYFHDYDQQLLPESFSPKH